MAASLLVGGLSLAPAASAGTYHYYACRLPSYETTPLGDWTLDTETVGYGPVDCATNGYAAQRFGIQQTSTDWWTGVGITMPAGLRATSITADRQVSMAPSTGPADYHATPAYSLQWGTGPRLYAAGNAVLESCDQISCGGLGQQAGTQRVSFTPATDAGFVGFGLTCKALDSGGACYANPDYRVAMRLNFLDLTVRDDQNPTITAPSGSLLQSGPRSGRQSLAFAAADVGSGVYQAILTVDGSEFARITPDAASSCANRAGLSPTALEFRRLQPCAGNIGVTFDVDTTTLSNATHRITAQVRDASGNLSNIVSQDVVVANAAPAPPVVANGTGGSLATAQLGRKGERKTLKAKYQSKASITGTLVDAAGTPIAGATVDVFEQLDLTAAPKGKVATVVTDAKGAYRYMPTTTASRTIQFAYATSAGSADYAARRDVLVAVTAQMKIAAKSKVVAPRGLVSLSGRVRLAVLPARGALVDLQARQSNGWQTVGTARLSKSGRWTYTRRLTRAAHVTLAFRARLRQSSDLPAAVSTSRPINVRVR